MKFHLKAPLFFILFFMVTLAGMGLAHSGETPATASRNIRPAGTPGISGGAEMARMQGAASRLDVRRGVEDWLPGIIYRGIFDTRGSIEAINFNQDATNNSGQFHVPPDPMGAVGPNHVVNVVNTSIEWYTKAGVQQNSQSLSSFFAPLTPLTNTFDPKVIYDQYENRFVVVTLEITDMANGDPANTSRILVAVSDDNDPNGTWYFHSENSMLNFFNPNLGGNFDHWADYPGFALDNQAIYIATNMFTFGATPTNGGVRLWIMDKGVAGGFYSGNPASVTVYSPYDSTAAAGSIATTTQPTHMFGAPPSSMGTFLVSYSGLSSGGSEFVQVIRVDNPLSNPSFHHQFVPCGDIDNTALSLPDAPQMGSGEEIEVNDRRALHAVWRNNSLWMTAEVMPPSGPDAFQTTAHWWQLNTTNLNTMTVADQGDVGGEEISTGTFTFFPSIAANMNGDMAIGFAASDDSIYPGAYYTGRLSSDPPGTVQAPGILRQGLDFYVRRFGGSRNRWGDYSGISLDPADQTTFWVYNEYAITRGTVIPPSPDDGRWGTAWGDFTLPLQSSPDIDITPTAFTFNVPVGGSDSQNLTISNVAAVGSQDLTWSLTQQKNNLIFKNDELPTTVSKITPGDEAKFNKLFRSQHASQYQPGTLPTPVVEPEGVSSPQTVSLILDDGTRENSIGLTSGGQFLWFNRFTPAPSDFPFTLEEVQILFGMGVGVNVGEEVDIYVYEDTDGDGDPGTGANLLGQLNGAAVQFVDDVTFSVYAFPPTVFNGPGDVLIAAVNRTAGVAAGTFVAAIDQTSSQGRSWVGSYLAGDPPDPPTLPADNLWGTIDSFGLAGNWMIRGFGNQGGACAWLTLNPTGGTTAPGGNDVVSVSVDASGLAQGQYNCTIVISSNDPNDPTLNVPVVLNVGPVSVDDEFSNLPEGFRLEQNYPNPFNPSTVISYRLAEGSEVRLTIYDLLGQQVRQLISDVQPAGEYRIEWDGRNDDGNPVTSGIFLYRLQAGKYSDVKKMILMR